MHAVPETGTAKDATTTMRITYSYRTHNHLCTTRKERATSYLDPSNNHADFNGFRFGLQFLCSFRIHRGWLRTATSCVGIWKRYTMVGLTSFTSSHDGAKSDELRAKASATADRARRGNTLSISTRHRSGYRHASARMGDQRPVSPHRASSSMSHSNGISPCSPLTTKKDVGWR